MDTHDLWNTELTEFWHTERYRVRFERAKDQAVNFRNGDSVLPFLLLAVIFETDKFQILRSRNCGIGGEYFSLANVESKVRNAKEFIFELSLIHHKEKTSDSVIELFVNEIIKLRKGFHVYHAGVGRVVRVVVQCFSLKMDMVEKNHLCGIVTPGGGLHPCSECFVHRTRLNVMLSSLPEEERGLRSNEARQGFLTEVGLCHYPSRER